MNFKRITLLSFIPALLLSCSGADLSLEERLHQAYLDSIEATSEKLRPLVNLTKNDEKVIWNNEGDKVLLFTLHRYTDS